MMGEKLTQIAIKEDLISNSNKKTDEAAEDLNWKVLRRKRGGICDK